ncbi:hypothetical protein L7F22_060243 [Adiantum nelumboides]|nr:hypothetical protein [Adiantum nelumboides]
MHRIKSTLSSNSGIDGGLCLQHLHKIDSNTLHSMNRPISSPSPLLLCSLPRKPLLRPASRWKALLPPSGGLPQTKNVDLARDIDLPLKKKFYLQALSPPEAAARAKESAKDIVNVKSLIEKKAWPYVQNDLHLKASYLCFDVIKSNI